MSNNPAHKKEWDNLNQHVQDIKSKNIRDFLSNDAERFQSLSQNLNGLFFDYSKQHIDKKTITLLCDLARSCKLEEKRDAMFSGSIVNPTEDRAALHTALRQPITHENATANKTITNDIQAVLEKIKFFSDNVRKGQYKGATGKPIDKVVSIGVGGSDLGPRLVARALKNKKSLPTFFVSNIDSDDLIDTLEYCDPETTLFIVISKSFKTQETLVNAHSALKWLKRHLPQNVDPMKHFVGVSANKNAVCEFGIDENNFFSIWDWVNGRFSLWSAVGLPIALNQGFDIFENLLAGAYIADQHFKEAPLDQNIPVLMGLISIWNRNFLDYSHHAVLAYAQKLSILPAYLQQLEMESNGKTIDLDGQEIIDYKTSPIVFGDVGTNGQHSFYQLLHQGSDTIPADFIGVIEDNNHLQQHHQLLLNNMLAQGQTMMEGQQNPPNDEAFRYFEGNKPSSAFLLNKLDAKHLGILLALYEHKCFVQGAIWNINSFDQFGVELGKTMAGKLEAQDLSDADNSTKGLYSLIHNQSKSS